MSQSLHTEIDALVCRGLFLPADDDVDAFLVDVASSMVRGEITEQQAFALCEMLGLGHGDLAAAVQHAN